MNKYLGLIVVVAVAIGMAINIQWDKESIKAFITGGVLVWMGMRFCRQS